MSTETMQERTQATETKPATPSQNVFRPVVDIVERQEELAIVAEMPGVTAEQLEIHFEDGVLRIAGHVGLRRDPGARYLLQEYGIGGFFREFQVSDVVDASRITAELGDGVLTLHLPKVEAIKPRKIEVTVK